MEKKSLRKAYGETLVELGKIDDRIVALEADLGKSTMSYMFQEAYPERFFEMGIAEQNMASTSAGLALTGKVPFYSTFAVFAVGRAYDQIRCSIAIANANVKICGSSCGLSDFGDGKTHQSIEDANIMKTLPHMVVLNPCDAVETAKMVRAAAQYEGPVYIRINRNDLPVFTAEEGEYEIGKLYEITKGTDVVIFATGAMVWKSVEAAALLQDTGISAQVVNVSSLKPIREEEVLSFVTGKKAVVTVDESTKIGGLGSTIASILMGKVSLPFEQLGVEDEFGRSARAYEELLEKYHLTEQDIVRAVEKAVN